MSDGDVFKSVNRRAISYYAHNVILTFIRRFSFRHVPAHESIDLINVAFEERKKV